MKKLLFVLFLTMTTILNADDKSAKATASEAAAPPVAK